MQKSDEGQDFIVNLSNVYRFGLGHGTRRIPGYWESKMLPIRGRETDVL
jgi:hypothetical protein